MENDIKQFLDSIQELEDKKFKTLQVSAAQEIDCSPLTFKQQKEIISTVADGMIGVIRFQKILNDILLKNTGNDNLSLEDKLPITLKIRHESIGDTIKIDGEDTVFTSAVEASQKGGTFKYPRPETVKGSVAVKLGIPTLKEENKVLSYAIDQLKGDGEKDVGKNIGNIYTYEIIKFIASVKFGEQELDFSSLPVKDRVKVVESLPLTINKGIVKYIEKFKDVDREILKVEDKAFDIDVTFFDN